jgi:hypothetical protein
MKVKVQEKSAKQDNVHVPMFVLLKNKHETNQMRFPRLISNESTTYMNVL